MLALGVAGAFTMRDSGAAGSELDAPPRSGEEVGGRARDVGHGIEVS